MSGTPIGAPGVIIAVNTEYSPVGKKKVTIPKAEVYLRPSQVIETLLRVEKEDVRFSLIEGNQKIK